MSGLLQRLARQATGTGGSSIRSAAKVHAPVPIAMSPSMDTGESPHFEKSASSTAGHRLGDSQARARASGLSSAMTDEWARSGHAASSLGSSTQSFGTASEMPDVPQLMPTELAPPSSAAVGASFASAPNPASRLSEREATSASTPSSSSLAYTVSDARRDTAAREPSEVHVHIGRIEVTTLQVPAAESTRKRRASSRQALPLADYLAKRRPS